MNDASSDQLTLLYPQWPAPERVKAWVTTRETGPSEGAFAHFNPAASVGDDPDQVAACRRQLLHETGNRPLNWLKQVHGTQVLTNFQPGAEADAALATSGDYACVVLTADCLPVFFCDRQGTRVAVAHAGWRGLADGVLENTVKALGVAPEDLLVWLGPAIGARVFEVGPEVRQAFLEGHPEAAAAFVPSPFRLKHYMADLYRLARQRLENVGVEQVFGGNFCTLSDRERFYSYRRDGQTGRMASVIWLES
ncbi:peptidoglycan editing factor PgeF [Marinospirillum perlucidum]|uniref:peptidoglycan editing factor PgeF n=1 Tax=Marinospirillum perlucidum TaxID=1982602 RepID=UPI000DF3AB81|nr:peptidoglycan editing factor PgeF [Marinospirillum perlucidum]